MFRWQLQVVGVTRLDSGYLEGSNPLRLELICDCRYHLSDIFGRQRHAVALAKVGWTPVVVSAPLHGILGLQVDKVFLCRLVYACDLLRSVGGGWVVDRIDLLVECGLCQWPYRVSAIVEVEGEKPVEACSLELIANLIEVSCLSLAGRSSPSDAVNVSSAARPNAFQSLPIGLRVSAGRHLEVDA